MFGALICEKTKAELLDATQTLKLRGIDQAHHQFAFIRVSLQTNDVVNWIAVDAFGHCANLNRRLGLSSKSCPRVPVGSDPKTVRISGFSHFFGYRVPHQPPIRVG